MTPRLLPSAALLLLASIAPVGAEGLERLRYDHPGLVVDLGVGLWAWPLPMDFDGDGDLDLVVNCPDKPSNGIYFFENATGDTARHPMPVFRPGVRIGKGAQNVQISDPDGRALVMTPGKSHPDFRRTGIEKSEALSLPANVHPNKVRANMWRMVDFDGDGLDDVVVGVGDWTEYGWDNAYDAHGRWMNGPLRGYVYVARNTGTKERAGWGRPEKVQAGGDRPVETYGWPSPNFADWDGDGDLDLLCGEFLDGFTYFQNVGTRTEPQYALGKRVRAETGAYLTMELQMITPTAIDWNRDGRLDLIVGDEDGRVAFVENAGKLTDEVPVFRVPRYFQQEADEVKFGALATPCAYDWDGDGDIDLISGNTAGHIAFIENLSGKGVARPRWAAPKLLEADGRVIRPMAGPNGSIQGPCEAKWGYTTQTVADWDGDGLPDLVVNSILGKVMWFRNSGTRTKPRLDAARPVEVAWEGLPPGLAYGWLKPEGNALLTQWRTTPVAMDWNGDSLTDLVMLDQEGFLAFFERSRLGNGTLELRPPRRVFHDEQGKPLHLAKGIAGKSGRRKLCVADWDGDGKLDLLLNSANANLLRQTEARPDGTWRFRDEGPLVAQNIEGHDVSPTTVDWDGDGVPDFLGGAEDGRFYFHRNPRSADTK